MLKLIKPTTKYKDSFIAAVREFKAEEKQYVSIIEQMDLDAIEQDFPAYVQSCLDEETTPRKPGWVTATTFWVLSDNEVVGIVSIRHRLTEHLRASAGHIGGGIRPTQRRKGYATQMLGMALKEARKLGIFRVMLACEVDNIGSQKIIEKHGGVLEDVAKLDEADPEPTMMRWWVDLNKYYDYKTLLQLYLGHRTSKQPVPSSKQYHQMLVKTLLEAFGLEFSQVEISEQPGSRGAEVAFWWLFRDIVHCYWSIPELGSGDLLSPRSVGMYRYSSNKYTTATAMYEIHQHKGDQAQPVIEAYRNVRRLQTQTKEALLELLYAHFELIYGKVDTVVTSEDLLALGFDDSETFQFPD